MSTLDADVAEELAEAIKEAEDYVNGTISYSGQHLDVEKKLINAMIKAGAWPAPEGEKEELPIFSTISLLIYDNFGTDGYSEIAADFAATTFNFVFTEIIKPLLGAIL